MSFPGFAASAALTATEEMTGEKKDGHLKIRFKIIY